jgi:hypothetical protein
LRSSGEGFAQPSTPLKEIGMRIFMREFTIPFTARAGAAQQATTTVNVPARPLSPVDVQVMMKGFSAGYSNGDHHILQLEVDLGIGRISAFPSPSPQSIVPVVARLLLRDSSGNIDDPFEGFVQGVLVAQVPD